MENYINFIPGLVQTSKNLSIDLDGHRIEHRMDIFV